MIIIIIELIIIINYHYDYIVMGHASNNMGCPS